MRKTAWPDGGIFAETECAPDGRRVPAESEDTVALVPPQAPAPVAQSMPLPEAFQVQGLGEAGSSDTTKVKGLMYITAGFAALILWDRFTTKKK